MDGIVSSIMMNTRGMALHEAQTHDMKSVEDLIMTYGEVAGENGHGLRRHY